MDIKTAEIVHVYPTDVWFEKDMMGTVHIKMQHQAPGMAPFTIVTINYDYAYTSNSHQDSLAKQIGALLGRPNIEQRPWRIPKDWHLDMDDYEEGECHCYTCNKDRTVKSGIPWVMTRMIVCPKCGNKRCPHATDHTLDCTKSNDPGQEGSRY